MWKAQKARFPHFHRTAATAAISLNTTFLLLPLYLPSVKLEKKVRVGSKVRRVYSAAQTPLQRVLASGQGDRQQLAKLQKLRAAMDPFELSQRIERKLEMVYTLANRRLSPNAAAAEPKQAVEMTRVGKVPKADFSNPLGKPAKARASPHSHSPGGGCPVTFLMSRRPGPRLHS